jgi:hypothetical protein
MAFRWWRKYGTMFPTIGFSTKQILKIIGFQIETKRIFSLVGIFINLKICHLQLDNIKILIFVKLAK